MEAMYSVDELEEPVEWEGIPLLDPGAPRLIVFARANDEAFAGHPLADRGLHSYGVFLERNFNALIRSEPTVLSGESQG